ncbi:hypothetical protein MP638_000465 [Amoeboaphelidium occidentale]|nr:hypothetical protein MP638_000465 [Amoeboaphelidium occidentale]
MTDSSFSANTHMTRPDLIDLVDDEWRNEVLELEEAETESVIPEPVDELNDDVKETEDETNWCDLGLDEFDPSKSENGVNSTGR